MGDFRGVAVSFSSFFTIFDTCFDIRTLAWLSMEGSVVLLLI